MAPQRSVSFPLSYVETGSRTSPFAVSETQVSQLAQCHAFRTIRDVVSCQSGNKFCDEHRTINREDEEAWKLHRDITHALILPVIGLYQHASRLATSLLGNDNIFDLELLFRGEARGAFAWLQCFIVGEADWCNAKGCPACNVSVILDAEPTIRMILVACRLSHSLRKPHEDSKFPVLDFWLDSLRTAMHQDSFWGPELWNDITKRAIKLENGVHELVRQCYQLEYLAAEPPHLGRICLLTRDSSKRSRRSRRPLKVGDHSQLTRQQDAEMQKLVLACWTTLLADATKMERKPSSRKQRPPLRTVASSKV